MGDLLSLINETYPNNRQPDAPLMVVRTIDGGTSHGRVQRCDPRGLVLENGEGKVIIPLHAIVAITDRTEAFTHDDARSGVDKTEQDATAMANFRP